VALSRWARQASRVIVAGRAVSGGAVSGYNVSSGWGSKHVAKKAVPWGNVHPSVTCEARRTRRGLQTGSVRLKLKRNQAGRVFARVNVGVFQITSAWKPIGDEKRKKMISEANDCIENQASPRSREAWAIALCSVHIASSFKSHLMRRISIRRGSVSPANSIASKACEARI